MFKSTHDLEFQIGQWHDQTLSRFIIGTVDGLWTLDNENYIIVSITNKEPNNGHFEDVLDWFYHGCEIDGKNLKIIEIENAAFMAHLIEKRGFVRLDKNNVQKIIK